MYTERYKRLNSFKRNFIWINDLKEEKDIYKNMFISELILLKNGNNLNV